MPSVNLDCDSRLPSSFMPLICQFYLVENELETCVDRQPEHPVLYGTPQLTAADSILSCMKTAYTDLR
ncbi:unnamed protein product [Toxocara canis]|uniref:Uncharacterized protein n=1 Tax=Toxocara canis TaxID=6265 RepID=A0A183UI43_TOXCA|nr:unnamed protein product [Toxocara canis]